jgi:hypothetical protein
MQSILDTLQQMLSDTSHKLACESDKDNYKLLLHQRKLLNNILDDILKLNSLHLK